MSARWDECEAEIRETDGDGVERVVSCDLGRHAQPGDNTARHHDPVLDINWSYSLDTDPYDE